MTNNLLEDDTAVKTSKIWKRLITGKNFKVLSQNIKDKSIKQYRYLRHGIMEDDEWSIMTILSKKVQTSLSQYKIAEINTTTSTTVKTNHSFFTYKITDLNPYPILTDVLYEDNDRILNSNTMIFDTDSRSHKSIHELAQGKNEFTHKAIVVDSSLDIKSKTVKFKKLNPKETFSQLIDVRFYRPGIIIGSQGLVITI